MCVSLLISTASLAAYAVSLTTQVTTLTVGAAATAVARRKAIATAVLRTKAKARIRRGLVAVPIAGIAAAAAFERQDYLEWKEDNPDSDIADYGCEMSVISAELVDEVLQELPSQARPPRDLILSQLPECK